MTFKKYTELILLKTNINLEKYSLYGKIAIDLILNKLAVADSPFQRLISYCQAVDYPIHRVIFPLLTGSKER